MNFSALLKNLMSIAVMLISGTATSRLCLAQYSFTPLGFVPGQVNNTRVRGISADGSAVVGFFDPVDPFERAFRWTSVAGMSALGGLEKLGGSSFAWDVSANGSIVVGHSSDRAFRWTEADGPVAIGDLPDGTPTRHARGTSSDGSVVVGDTGGGPGTQAFRWTAGSGSVGLGDLQGGVFRSEAWRVSPDGSVVVGRSDSASGPEAFRWTQPTGMIAIGDLTGGAVDSLALNVSSDGSVVVGWSESSNGREAFRWTEAGGMVGLGDLQGGVLRSIASGISADGSVIVGTGNSTGTFFGEAFLWTQPTGMMNLKEFLATGGATGLTGWTLLGDVYVSGDGTRIAGTGRNPAGLLEPWIATIPPIPEPSTWALAACALFFGGLLVRRRRKFARALASGV